MRFYDAGLDDHVEAFFCPLLSRGPLKFDQGDCCSHAVFSPRLRAREMNLAEPTKSVALAERNVRRDFFEIAVMCEQDAVAVLCNLGDDWVGCICWQYVTKAGHTVPASL